MTYFDEEYEEEEMDETAGAPDVPAIKESVGGNTKKMNNDTNPFQLSLAADVVILNTPLTAMIEKHADSSMELLIMPQYQLKAEQFTLADFINGINDAIKGIAGSDMFKLDTDAIKDKLSGFLDSVDGISVMLQQVFLHVRFGGDSNSDTSLEYAFSIKITSKTPETKGFTFAEIQSISFGIWNTTRESILSMMGLTSISERIGD